MENYGINQQDSFSPRPWLSLLLIVIHYFVGIFVGQFVGLLLAMVFFGIGPEELLTLVSNFRNNPDSKYIMFFLQGGAAIGAFVIAPLYYLRRFENKNLSAFFNKRAAHIIPVLLTVFITLFFMNVNTLLIEWNTGINFPDWLSWLEEILIAQEEQARELTRTLTRFSSVSDFLIAILVVAVIPGFGEELVFRGLFQNTFQRIFVNPHAAIWVTAFIFGALHFQFYGLVPRMFLGAIFGYLYYWSGSLLLPMLAHFINNSFGLSMLYLHQLGEIEQDVSEAPSLPYSYILVFLLLGIFCFWYYRSFFLKPVGIENEQMGEGL